MISADGSLTDSVYNVTDRKAWRTEFLTAVATNEMNPVRQGMAMRLFNHLKPKSDTDEVKGKGKK